jgi:CBS domain-containing protein
MDAHRPPLTSPPTPELASLLLARVADVPLHPPLVVAATATFTEAARTMQERRATSLLVKGDRGLGIFTATDMRDGIAAGVDPASAPVGAHASFDPVTIESQETLATALMVMSTHSIQRLVVVRGGEVVGVLEQLRLLAFLADHSLVAASRIRLASSLADLAAAVESIERLLEELSSAGVRIEHLAHLISGLHQRVYARLFDWVFPPDLRSEVCLIVMGSEGRGEQLRRTDQDNGLIVRGGDLGAARAACERFSASLAELGWPPCPGRVMVNNPQWAKPQAAYLEDVARWVLRGDAESVMELAIFLDAQPVAGDPGLLGQVKDRLFAVARDNSVFHSRFAAAVDLFPDAVSWLGRLKVAAAGESAGRVDLKRGGTFPVVHGVRSLALQLEIRETGTFERIRAIAQQGLLDGAMAAELQEAYAALLSLRLNAGKTSGEDNTLDPASLSPLGRKQLRENLRVVSRFKEVIRYHFRLHSALF